MSLVSRSRRFVVDREERPTEMIGFRARLKEKLARHGNVHACGQRRDRIDGDRQIVRFARGEITVGVLISRVGRHLQV